MKKIFLSFLLAWFISTNFFWISENFWVFNIEKVSAECTAEDLEKWLPCSEDWIKTLEENQDQIDSWISKKSFRESVMDTLNYFLILLWILWVLVIIYSWVQAIVWWEEEVKNAKWRILWVIIWFVIIFLSYSIINFIWNIWWSSNSSNTSTNLNINWWDIIVNNDEILTDENWENILTPDWKLVYINNDWNYYAIDDDWNKYLVDVEWKSVLDENWDLIYLDTKIVILADWKEINSVLRVNILDSWLKWILFDPSETVAKESRDIEEYLWEFWDWNQDFYENPESVRQFYEDAWTYYLIFSLRDDANEVSTKRIKVVVQDLSANIEINPDEIYLWSKISFDWSESKSSDWKISSYLWEIYNSDWKIIKTSEEDNFSFVPDYAWEYKVWLTVRNLKWKENYLDKAFFVNSNKPKSMFNYSNKSVSTPWIFIFDWGSSYDIDWDSLKYSWDFDWDWKYEILKSDNFKTAYSYPFVWDYNVYLKVEDQYWQFDLFNQKVSVSSVLNVDFDVDRYASQKWWNINFTPIAPVWVNSILWDFKDWKKETTTWLDKISHTFNESWIYTIQMTAINRDWEQNSVIKNIFIWDWEYPVWVFQTYVNWEQVSWKIDMCWEWKDWIEISRLDQIELNAKDSINLDNTNWWLSFTWDFWDWNFAETQVARHKYRLVREECYPIKVSVKDNYSKKVAKLSDTMRVRVINEKPSVWNLQIIADQNDDLEYITPLKVKLNLENSFDEDWNIVKYKWYYQKPFTEEKLWYIETFTNNVEFLIEADWVKWLTNDYIFNVEVEDNEWWVNSIFDTYWEINKISVKNWETNSLNLDFEVNKTQVSVWEQVIFRVKDEMVDSKNIVYLWDFNWDEEIDKKTQSKITEYTFNKKWTYRVELRVDNNWVFERVYKTIYVDESYSWNEWASIIENPTIEDYFNPDEIISTDLWIKLKWEWISLTSLNVRNNKYPNNEFELIVHITNSDATIYEWKVEFQIIEWNWEIINSEISAINSIAKTRFKKTWDWIVKIKIIAKDTIYWDLEEVILVE